jgi:2'-5' RNA ligase
MRFLGDVDLGLHEPLFTALARVRVEPFVLPVGGVGVFPPRGTPRVLWIGIERGHPRLFQLRQQVDDAILSTGFDLDVREFHPHITLARIKSETPPGAVAQFRRRHEAFEAAPFRAEVLHLYASELRPNGAVHTLRRSFPLTGD